MVKLYDDSYAEHSQCYYIKCSYCRTVTTAVDTTDRKA